jgi:ATP-dependent Lon protease
LKVVLLPEKNLKDMVDVPKRVREDLKIIPIQHMDQVLEIALATKTVLEPPHPRRKQEETTAPEE